MQFAKINGKLVAAASGLNGLCTGCDQPVVAKCGELRIHHWAHVVKKNCDRWWERETEWHRQWKNKFPVTWHEVFLPDQKTGEKHMADIQTNEGAVIEFQHSHINPQERVARESFYKKMVWVVDGTRLTRDYPRFDKARAEFKIVTKGVFRIGFPEECFPSTWITSTVPVIFDFLGTGMLSESDAKNDLYCLMPGRLGLDAIVVVLSRNAFITSMTDGKLLTWFYNLMNALINQRQNQIIRQQNKAIAAKINSVRRRYMRTWF